MSSKKLMEFLEFFKEQASACYIDAYHACSDSDVGLPHEEWCDGCQKRMLFLACKEFKDARAEAGTVPELRAALKAAQQRDRENDDAWGVILRIFGDANVPHGVPLAEMIEKLWEERGKLFKENVDLHRFLNESEAEREAQESPEEAKASRVFYELTVKQRNAAWRRVELLESKLKEQSKAEKEGYRQGLLKASRMASRRAQPFAPIERCKDKGKAWASQDTDLYEAYTTLAKDLREKAQEFSDEEESS